MPRTPAKVYGNLNYSNSKTFKHLFSWPEVFLVWKVNPNIFEDFKLVKDAVFLKLIQNILKMNILSDQDSQQFMSDLAWNLVHFFFSKSGFILFGAFEIPWLPMTFSTTFQSFPWPQFDHFPRHFLKHSLDLHLIVFYFARENCLNYFFCTVKVIFHDFPWPTLKFHDFPGLENEILKFPWLVQTLQIPTSLLHFW